jgi:hypothetical protein
MNKKSFLFATSLTLIASLTSLVSCSVGGSSSATRSVVFTVSFYDSQDLSHQVGFAYAAYGESASFKASDGEKFPTSTKDQTLAPGYGFSFDKWTGKYSSTTSPSPVYSYHSAPVEEEDVDLSFIKGDCSVYATFTQEKLLYGVLFHNGGELMRDSDDVPLFSGDTFSFGNTITLPSNPSTTSTWGKDTNFTGYSFSSSATAPDVTTTNYGTNTKFYYGEGEPGTSVNDLTTKQATSTITSGSIYENTSDQKLFVYSGSSWTALNKTLSIDETKAPIIDYYAVYDKTTHDFPIKLYASEADYLTGSNPSSTVIYGAYESSLTLTSTSVSATNVSGETKNITLDAGKTYVIRYSNLSADYDGNKSIENYYKGKTLESSSLKVNAPIGIYPAA